jgi:flagellin
MRDLAFDALEADSTITTAYTIAKDGEFGIKMTANTVATDFELTVSSTNSTLAKQAKIEDLTISGEVNAGDAYRVDFGNGNVAEYIVTDADANADDATASVRDNLMSAISATGLVSVEASDSDTIRMTAAVTGVDFRGVSSASNSVSDSQIEEITVANVEAGDAFSVSINGEAVSYTAQSGDTAEDVAAWFADNADITGFTMSASGASLTVSGEAGVSYNLQAQATNYAGGLQEETLSVSGTLDRGDTYTVSIDGENIATKVEQGDTKSDLLNRIAENVNSAAGDKVAASVNDDGTLSLRSAQNGVSFAASVEVDDNGRGADTISTIDISTEAGASAAGAVILGAISQVNDTRAQLGAIENRLDHTINNLGSVVVNSEASKSRIFDADFAQETVSLTKGQILSQAATSMLAQANQSKQTVLALLQG